MSAPFESEICCRHFPREGLQTTIRAIRSLLAAIDNAEALPAEEASFGGAHVAKAALGAGAGDRPRRELANDDLAETLQAEIDERLTARAEYSRGGRQVEAGEIAQEVATLAGYGSLIHT